MNDALILENLPYVDKVAKLCAIQWGTFHLLQDMISAARLALVECANRNDPSKGDFKTFSGWNIRGKISDELSIGCHRMRRSTYKREKEDGRWEYFAVDSVEYPFWGCLSSDGEDRLFDRIHFLIDAEKVLSPRKKQILRGYLSGKTMKSIGSEVGVAECRISQLLKEIIQELRAS